MQNFFESNNGHFGGFYWLDLLGTWILLGEMGFLDCGKFYFWWIGGWKSGSGLSGGGGGVGVGWSRLRRSAAIARGGVCLRRIPGRIACRWGRAGEGLGFRGGIFYSLWSG